MGSQKKPASVALVDDDPIQIELLTEYLGTLDLTPTTFQTAEELYQCPQRFDLVITDLNLPNDSGFDVCTFLKNNKNTADTYIIFISSVDDAETVASAYAAGANGYLTKPIIPVEFICQVENILKQSFLSSRLKSKSKQARAAAKSSMLESERLHLLIEFVQEASSAKSFASMAEVTFNFMSAVGMAGSLMLHIDDQHICFADDGNEREFERRLMMELWKKVHTDANHQTRFFSSKGRVAASFDNCSMFIRGVAAGQEDSLLDFLGLFMNQLDRCAEKAHSEQQIIQYLSEASQVITEVDQELARVDKTLEYYINEQYDDIRSQVSAHMQEISGRISRLIPGKQSQSQ